MRTSLIALKRISPLGLLFSVLAFAQQGPMPPPRDPLAAQQPAPVLSPQQLDNLVAPIALYPDPLLGQVLAATTYPLEVIEAQQWLRQAGNLRGQELIDAAKQQNWDPSVQALVAFPDVLALLTRDIRWTRALGDAFLSQQADVMAAIQNMRASARNNGRLQNTPQQNVTVDQNGDQQAIAIQPADPQVIYPPEYDPAYVWGPPAYGAYPDLLYPDYGFGFYPPVYLGSFFGGYGGFGWGWGCNWFGRGLFVNGLFFNRYGFHGYRGFGNGNGTWAHDPGHRGGIPYSNRAVASRFSGGANGGNYAGRGGYSQGFAAQRSGAQGGYRSFSNAPSAGQGYRSFSNTPAPSGGQGYRSFSNQSRPAQNYRGFASPAPQQRSYQSFRSTPQQSFGAGAPRSNFSAPRMSAPHFSGGGGGGGRSGGGARSGGGGGGGARGGGGGGHRR